MRWAALLMLLAALPLRAEEAASQVVTAFYSKYLELRPSGLPDDDQLRALGPYLSEANLRAIQDARAYRDDYARKHPGDKPPFIEGCLFTSLFEGPTSFEISSQQPVSGGRVKVSVLFRYADPLNPRDVVRWQDAVIVAKEKKRYVIEDILFQGQWPFKIGDRLSRVLRARN